MLTTMLTMNAWGERCWVAMGAFLWQSTLLVAVAAVIAWLLRRSSPAVRFWLWQIVTVKLLVMPFWTFYFPLPAWAAARPAEQAVTARSAAGAVDDVDRLTPRDAGGGAQAHGGQAAPRPASFWEPLAAVTWQAWLLLLWLAIVLGQLARVASQRWRLARLLGQSAPADAEIAGLVAELAGELGLRRVPAVVSVAGECPLFVCGLWRPQLVLPARLMAALDGSARRQVLLHELAHVRRHDLLWGWPVEIARTVYFFHPLVYWVAYQLRLERELCCDQLAMLHSGHPPADYAQTLVEVVSERSGGRVQDSEVRGQDFGRRQPEES